jgi:hypothetical protein
METDIQTSIIVLQVCHSFQEGSMYYGQYYLKSSAWRLKMIQATNNTRLDPLLCKRLTQEDYTLSPKATELEPAVSNISVYITVIVFIAGLPALWFLLMVLFSCLNIIVVSPI